MSGIDSIAVFSDGKTYRETLDDRTDLRDYLGFLQLRADDLVSVQIVAPKLEESKPAGPFPNNRQGRRRWGRGARAKSDLWKAHQS